MQHLAHTTSMLSGISFDWQPEGTDAKVTLRCEIPRDSSARTCRIDGATSGTDLTSLREELEGIDLFEGASPEVFDLLTTFCPVRTVAAGEALLMPGVANDCLYVVLSGELLVHIGTEAEQHVVALRRGETVGEISLLDRRPASAYVTASEPTQVLVVGESTFWRICHASHGVTVRLLMMLAERLRNNNDTIQASIVQRAKLEEVAHRDALTNVQSRRWLDETLPQMCAAHQRSGKTLSVAVIDVDHFKRVNDTYGHQTGDVVLAEVAKVLRTKLRPSDFVARFGGEEFVVILPETYALGARVACERLLDAVRAATLTTREGDLLPRITVSVGIAELVDGDDMHSLFERADGALYRAKHNGRDRVEG